MQLSPCIIKLVVCKCWAIFPTVSWYDMQSKLMMKPVLVKISQVCFSHLSCLVPESCNSNTKAAVLDPTQVSGVLIPNSRQAKTTGMWSWVCDNSMIVLLHSKILHVLFLIFHSAEWCSCKVGHKRAFFSTFLCWKFLFFSPQLRV